MSERPYYKVPVWSHEVFKWPEFIALADRLGIPYELRTVGLQITLPTPDHPVIVTHGYQAVDRRKEFGGIVGNVDPENGGVIPPTPEAGDKVGGSDPPNPAFPEDEVVASDTTNLHAGEFRTFSPVVAPRDPEKDA